MCAGCYLDRGIAGSTARQEFVSQHTSSQGKHVPIIRSCVRIHAPRHLRIRADRAHGWLTHTHEEVQSSGESVTATVREVDADLSFGKMRLSIKQGVDKVPNQGVDMAFRGHSSAQLPPRQVAR
jgi:hypothetical protein